MTSAEPPAGPPAERYRRVKQAFARAVDLDGPAREAFLEEVAAGDAALAAEVRELLRHDELDTRLGRPLVSRRIGPYRVLERLGAGGMGEVFLAEQREPLRRRVAVKVIRADLASREVAARFATERQALALMEHPAIARVLDAGETGDGRPYIAMEYVPGVPLTTYCDERRLSTAERLELFLRVCDGVQHAHQKGVIHRDLKPSNVLVADLDGEPRPKIIDFGIAKALARPLTDASLHTELGRAVGTPAYMSPEQLASAPEGLDTRSDLYSLGVLLYELLVGVRPIEETGSGPAGLPRLWRRIQEEDPAAPSTRAAALGDASIGTAWRRRTDPGSLVRRLRGDLDWIVLKALEKDRSRRYAAVSELAAEICRHLRDEPVLAGPPSSLYRLHKLVRRHRLAVAAASLVLIAVLGGVVGTSLALGRARVAERSAQEEAAAARQVADFLVDLFRSSDPFAKPGRPLTTDELLEGSVERIHRDLADRPLVQGRLLTTLGQVFANLGEYERAEVLAEAVRLREAQLGPAHPDTAESLYQLGNLRWAQGRYDEAARLLGRALEVQERVLGPDDRAVADTVQALGDVHFSRGAFDRAAELMRRALALRERSLGPDHVDLASSINNLALVAWSQGRYEEALPGFERALAIVERSTGPDHPQVASIVNNLGGCYWALERYDEAEPYLRRALEIRQRTLPADHPDVAKGLSNLGEVLLVRGEVEEGERRFHEALAILGEGGNGEPLDAAHPHLGLGRLHLSQQRFELAERHYRKALAIRRTYLDDGHPSVAEAWRELAAMLERAGRTREAAEARARAGEDGARPAGDGSAGTSAGD